MSGTRNGKVLLEGQLIPREYDEDGSVIEYIFAGDDDRIYMVESGNQTLELEEYANQYLKVRGVVRKHKGDYMLKIRKIEQIDNDLLIDE